MGEKDDERAKCIHANDRSTDDLKVTRQKMLEGASRLSISLHWFDRRKNFVSAQKPKVTFESSRSMKIESLVVDRGAKEHGCVF